MRAVYFVIRCSESYLPQDKLALKASSPSKNDQDIERVAKMHIDMIGRCLQPTRGRLTPQVLRHRQTRSFTVEHDRRCTSDRIVEVMMIPSLAHTQRQSRTLYHRTEHRWQGAAARLTKWQRRRAAGCPQQVKVDVSGVACCC